MKLRRDLLVSFAALAVLAVSAPSANAYKQNYCGIVLQPGGPPCASSGLHSFGYSFAYYPGPEAHHVTVCTYLWNARTQQVRGGVIDCGDNTAAVGYWPTTQPDYNARAYLPATNCCAHTVNARAGT